MSRLDEAIDYAFAALERVGDPAGLDPALGAVVIIVSVQGVIDNGGLEAFFGGDFPGSPPYGLILDAYRTIGATGAVDTLEEALAQIDLPDPHLYRGERMRRIEALTAAGVFQQLSDRICGDAEVWSRLKEHVERHAHAFGLP